MSGIRFTERMWKSASVNRDERGMWAGRSFSQKAVRIGRVRPSFPSYAAGLEDVVIETSDRGQSPNGRSWWSQSTHHPSITVPNPARARGCDLYVFHLRITYPCRSTRSHSPLLSALLHTIRPFSARTPCRSCSTPFRSISFSKPRRPVVSRLAASIIIRISRHSWSFGCFTHSTYKYLPQLTYFVAISWNVHVTYMYK